MLDEHFPPPASASFRLWASGRERPLVLGHRGAPRRAPENTLLAFELAAAEGADGVEFDVRLDGSNELIVLHDPDLERVTRGASRERAADLSSERIRAFDVGQGERIPRLADALAWARDRRVFLNIELKSDVPNLSALVRAVERELARENEAPERVLLSSFHPLLVRGAATLLPNVPVCWLVHDRQSLARLGAEFYRVLGARGVHPQHTLLSAHWVSHLKQKGAFVNTWTVNDPTLALAYARFGVDALISDEPGRIVRALSETRSAAD